MIKKEKSSKLVFEITSNDGFCVRARSCDGDDNLFFYQLSLVSIQHNRYNICNTRMLAIAVFACLLLFKRYSFSEKTYLKATEGHLPFLHTSLVFMCFVTSAFACILILHQLHLLHLLHIFLC